VARGFPVLRSRCLGQYVVGEGEPAAGFADADPQPGPKELRRVPVPVIQHAGRVLRLRTRGGIGRTRGYRTVGYCTRGPFSPAGPPLLRY
jgi:hypothetical protein